MEIIILTGSELRHEYFRKRIAIDKNIKVLKTYCEGTEKSLDNRIKQTPNISIIEIQHVKARTQSEKDFFGDFVKNIDDKSSPIFIPKGKINNDQIVNEIININPDLLICYGSSLIKSKLLTAFKTRFLNVHLGLSPYYRGSGTNVWPLINNEPDMVGATFMHIDGGIDTGKIIHQVRADIYFADSPHSIGNRLIKKMTQTYLEIIKNFNQLEEERQPKVKGNLYLKKDYNNKACNLLYDNFKNDMIKNFLNSNKTHRDLVKNKGLLK